MEKASEPVSPQFRAQVITVSTRAAAGVYSDTAGPAVVARLAELGIDVAPLLVVADGEPLRLALATALADDVDLVVTAGGTGLSPSDLTPQLTAEVIDFEVPGLADLIRASSWNQVPAAALSRGLVGVVGRTLVINLPGSVGGVRDGMDALVSVLLHALEQLAGADHPARPDQPVVGNPAVSGAPGVVSRAHVGEEPISVAEHELLVAGDDRGAVVSFGGVVRDHDHGRAVLALEYVGHPGAPAILARVAAAAAARPGVAAVAVSHRLGAMAIGEVALACAVSAAHRQAAFETCSWLVDAVKRELPVWKRQDFTDGTSEWVNCP